MNFITDKDGKKRKAKLVKCYYCNIEFLKPLRFIKKGTKNFCCKLHGIQYRMTPKTEVVCAVCGNTFLKTQSSLKNSKSGLYFCNKKCKNIGQTLKFGLTNVHPQHYGTGNGLDGYRKKALDHYPHQCECCSYNEHTKILQVHHIDNNRMNNEIDNLILLCPNCHSSITFKYANLIDRKLIWIDDC